MNTTIRRFLAWGLLAGALFVGSVQPAAATGCNSAATVVASDIGKQMATYLVAAGVTVVSGNWAAAYTSAKQWEKIAEMSIEYFNKMAGGSWAQIGPRPLVLGAVQKGRIIGTTGRIFITTTTLPSNSARIVVTERGGKGKVGVAICKANTDGRLTNLHEVTFNGSKKDKKDEDEKVEYVVSGVKDCVLQIHLDGKSAAKSFSYSIKIEPII